MKAVIDIETGGFSRKDHGICEIAMIIIDRKDQVVKEVSFLIEPYGKSYTESAFNVHGISEEELEIKGIQPYEACNMLVQFINRFNVNELIGHNIESFDFPFLQVFLDEFLIPLDKEEFHFSDTLKQARKENSDRKNDLVSLSEEYGFETEGSHRALKDCYLTYNLYKQLSW